MPIYDNDGTANREIGKVYDNDGSANREIGKVYDNDGTANREVYSRLNVLLYASGNEYASITGGWGAHWATSYGAFNGFTMASKESNYIGLILEGNTANHGCIAKAMAYTLSPINLSLYSDIIFNMQIGGYANVCACTTRPSGWTPENIIASGYTTLNVSNLNQWAYLCAYVEVNWNYAYRYANIISVHAE